MKRRMFAWALALALTALMSACGSTEEATTTAETATTTDEAAKVEVEAEVETASETPTLDAIEAAGVIKMATGTYVPFEYRDDDNNIVGFDVDLGQLVADKLGVELEVMDMTFTSIIPSIESGEYDFSFAAMYDTEARREVVNMTDSYMETGMVLVTVAGNPLNITSLADCEGLRVAVKAGATSEVVAQEGLESGEVTYEIVGYEDTIGCVSDLVSGRVDVVVNDLLNQKEINKTNDKVEIVCEPFTEAKLAGAVALGNEDLLDFINEVIAEYRADGTYETLFSQWID